MEKIPHGALIAVIVVLCLCGASQSRGQETGNLLVNTTPQGALVEVIGDVSVSGVSPVKFDRSLSGEFVVEVSRAGYEKYRSVNYFSAAQFSQLDINLVPKTRTKAGLRSLVIPGWGQRYYGDKTKSALFFIGTAVSAVGYLLAKDDFNSKRDDFYDARDAYTAATEYSQLVTLEAAMREAQQDADDAEDMVNLMIGVTAGVYALNLLDAILFFPQFDTYADYNVITARPRVDPEHVGITVAISF